MDLFVVDSNYNKTDVIDGFSAVVWTDRYNDSGDVTISVPATSDNKVLITEGIFVHTPVSQEIMLIDTIAIQDGVLTATGRSLVDFFKQRIFRTTWDDNVSSWVVMNYTAGNLINLAVQDMVMSGGYIANGTVLTSAQGTNEVFTKLSVAPSVSGSGLNFDVPWGNLFDAVKNIADADNLGFTMYPPNITDGTGSLSFKAYRGLDRTSSQSTNGVVIFDPAMDTLSSVNELRSISGYKNVAWVWPANISAQTQVGVAYAPGAQLLTGFQRRTLMVDASDIDAATYPAANLQSALAAKGRDALANNNYVKTVDGTVVPQGPYTYGTDYNLGDVIELRGVTGGASQKARITEYIRAQDSTGESAYPTLQVV